MRNSQLLTDRNKNLEADYNKLAKMAKYKKKPHLIYVALRKKYFITNRTIDAVLSGEYDKKNKCKVNPNQLTIFSELEQV